ncbi:Thiol-disulfide isomerase or thioredoxin [Flavobacterium sp. CF108]|uniref:TlpA family protein disulfide reductase n=1 Tax=unclassified Flavobacterium TaxID=196869 RepID=UPI0008AF6C51|nr:MULTISPECIES: TlpA disulfide reductase family protein [unclassified Flavobacterium]SEN58531.1 Thiol-disulfide isomerase or thioredoxin [Flavobacterium sp. fv08]SHH02125.1 Thiol-disulfide isomerase or thioredoxin [Flavobacterium sp. CF108]
MKKLLIAGLVLFSALNISAQSKKYVTFEANIANRNSDIIKILNEGRVIKTIYVDKNGIFKDTLVVDGGRSRLYDGVESTELFLKSGYDIKLKMDAKQFDESIVYTGKGSAENNILAQRILADEKLYDNSVASLDDAAFNKLVDAKKAGDAARLKDKKLDPEFVKIETENGANAIAEISAYRKEAQDIAKMNNKPSPEFDYENHKGGKTKLSDLKGKYVYIDLWATWCGPCRGEIPYLQKIEEKYHGKNIEFVSISVDTPKDHAKWQKFVTDKQLGGIQLFSDNEWKSEFVTSYNVTGIPRFILIDPKGNVVDANASRPSSPDLEKQLDSLLN